MAGGPISGTGLALAAGATGAMEFVPGDTEIYEKSRRGEGVVRSRISGSVRVSGQTPTYMARRQAIKAWEQQARRDFGEEFAQWLRARGRKIRCDAPGAAMYSCSASAIPGR
jgi:hypothetical protein